MKFVVLGAGMMGCAAVHDLARAEAVEKIIVGDYDLGRARSVSGQFGQGKARPIRVDVRDTAALSRLISDSAAVLNCTQYYWNLRVMRAALAARIHYLDLGGLFYTTRKQLQLDASFRRIGKLAILGIGSAPGIANVMARFLADQLDRVAFIGVYNGSRDFQEYSDALSFGFSIATILDELTIPPVHFRNGRFETRERFSGAESMNFPPPVGKLELRHSIHSEVATLPLSFKSKGVREVFFKINYDPKLIDLTETLASLGLLEQQSVTIGNKKVSPRALLEHLLKSRAPSAKPSKDVETIRVVVRGSKSGRPRTLSLDATTRYSLKPPFSAVARDTGFPISIAAQMLASGQISITGVHPPETAIPPREFLQRLDRLGVRIVGSALRKPTS